MQFYTEPERKIPVSSSVDVLVLGGGVAGVSAAIMAGRQGASVLVVDTANAVGGMSTTGLMSHFTGSVKSKLFSEIITRMENKRDSESYNAAPHFIDPEALKEIYLEMLEEAGAQVLFYTMACMPIMDGKRITGAIIENKNGRQAIMAKVVIDATGDGDIAARAGVPYYDGREGDRAKQPATLMFKLGGVDMSRAVLPGSFETLVDTEKGELQALAKSILPFPAGHVLLYPSPLPGIVTVNMTNAIEIDGSDALSLTKAEKICRSQMEPIVKFLREYAPGYEHCFIVSAAAMMGVRETRHFEGLYTLTKEDILAKCTFDDWIVREAKFNFDVHNMSGASLDKTGVQKFFPQDNSYQIPYRCCVPKEVEGLLLAGRLISGTHMAHSNFRSMPICIGIGEAVGTAAALAALSGCRVRDVDISAVQEIIK